MANELVPPPLLSHFQSRYQTVCWLWALQLPDGTWEGYTSLEHDVAGVEYSSDVNEELPYLGGPWNISDVPALTYRAIGEMAVTAQPVRLNLGRDGTDATTIALDRARLLRGGYHDATFEGFRVNYRDLKMGRHVRLSGRIGNRRVGVATATFELVPWPALAEATFSRTIGPLCDVGLYPGECFGAGRCRNATLNDGPLRADWTALATVVSTTGRNQMRASFGNVAVSGAALHSQFATRLQEGDVEFLAGDAGGDNRGVACGIKSATLASGAAGGPGQVDVTLHEELPFVPAAGDQLHLVAGCRRTLQDCKQYDNVVNFQGFPQVPGREGVIRRYGL